MLIPNNISTTKLSFATVPVLYQQFRSLSPSINLKELLKLNQY